MLLDVLGKVAMKAGTVKEFSGEDRIATEAQRRRALTVNAELVDLESISGRRARLAPEWYQPEETKVIALERSSGRKLVPEIPYAGLLTRNESRDWHESNVFLTISGLTATKVKLI